MLFFLECDSQCSDEASPIEMPPQLLAIGALVPLQKPSPERRGTQKEIIAGEERPKFLTIKQIQESGIQLKHGQNFLGLLLIICVFLKAPELDVPIEIPEPPTSTPSNQKITNEMPTLPVFSHSSSASVESMKNDMNATIIPKFNTSCGMANAITGILKGGKLRKTDLPQVRN